MDILEVTLFVLKEASAEIDWLQKCNACGEFMKFIGDGYMTCPNKECEDFDVHHDVNYDDELADRIRGVVE